MSSVRLLALAGLGIALACGGGGAPAPDEAPAPAPEGHDHGPAAPIASTPLPVEWPLVTLGTIPAGRAVPLPAGHTLLDLDLDPRGRFALVLTTDGTTPAAWRWDFGGALAPVAMPAARELALSAFDDTVYALLEAAPGWVIARGALGADGAWTEAGRVYESPAPLSALVVPFARWDDEERVFFAREHAEGRAQVLTARRSGAWPYEVTSPTGALGDRTAKEVREPPEDADRTAPVPLAAESATPLSVHPATGALLWRDGEGRVHRRRWDLGAGNWGADEPLSPAGEHWAWSPNGWFAVVWAPGISGVRLRNPDGTVERVDGPVFRAPPVTAENGRTLVGWTDAGLVTVAVPAALAPVRYLAAAGIPDATRATLARQGMAVTDTPHTQLYQPYDDILYSDAGGPVFVSVDGMLEVLHAGFRAVFVRAERDVSVPRLDAFLTELQRQAGGADERRVREIASLAKRMLHGDYAFPEGELAKNGGTAYSELHEREIDFGDFRPRGPYATSETLANYFRAFKYIDLLRLTDEERRSLADKPELVAAWKSWIDVQAPYLSGTRYEGLFGDGWAKSPHVLPDCLPTSIRENPKRVFPLSWGRDSEILERVTAHDDLPPDCTVPQRVVPSGLDLLTGLGSPHALAIQRAEYARWPQLEAAHAGVRQRFSGEVPSDRFVDAWLRLVQILGNDTNTPEGVSPEVWHRRLMETALASWTSFRHTTVLVNEGTAAQMGAGGEPIFEQLGTEPIRGAVDPVPAAWSQLGKLLAGLSASAQASPTTDRVAEVLATAATAASSFGSMAERQQRGEPLTEDEYQRIHDYAGTVEHPYLLLSAAAAGKEQEISEPDPMMRIVDIHTWNDPTGPAQYWHAAVGRPRGVTVLLGDRGVLVPAKGAVYGYYEVVAPDRVDDEAWRATVDATPRPPWVNRSQPTP